ncbi:MAG: class I SAM-dependent methyltransferase [Pseudomonadota bacterium]
MSHLFSRLDHDALPSAPVHKTALIRLAAWLREQGYAFTTPTPATHARVAARAPQQPAEDLRDVFGWSRCFKAALLPDQVLAWMRQGDVLRASADGESLSCTVRFSTLDDGLFMHSAWPTEGRDAVFFGPETYRFARFVQSNLPKVTTRQFTVCDVGCGSGAVGLLTSRWLGAAVQLHLVDINPAALETTRINAAIAGMHDAQVYTSNLLQGVAPQPHLVICNPPYLPDAEHRTYRDGGADYGSEVSLRLVRQAIQHLAPGGRLLLYTGTAVVAGQHVLARALMPLLDGAASKALLSYRYEELDPDVFGEELALPQMAEVERIAVVGLTVQMAPTRTAKWR